MSTGPEAALFPPEALERARIAAAPPGQAALPVTPGTPGERLERDLAAFLPGLQVARVMALAGEYAAAMIERHARRPGGLERKR